MFMPTFLISCWMTLCICVLFVFIAFANVEKYIFVLIYVSVVLLYNNAVVKVQLHAFPFDD